MFSETIRHFLRPFTYKTYTIISELKCGGYIILLHTSCKIYIYIYYNIVLIITSHTAVYLLYYYYLRLLIFLNDLNGHIIIEFLDPFLIAISL